MSGEHETSRPTHLNRLEVECDIVCDSLFVNGVKIATNAGDLDPNPTFETLQVSDDTMITGQLTVGERIVNLGPLVQNGAAALHSTLDVDGVSTFTGDVTFKGKVTGITTDGMTSITMSVPDFFSLTGSPGTGDADITIGYATGLDDNKVLGTNASGASGLLALTSDHIPSLSESKITGLVSDLAGKAAVSHTHDAGDIVSGELSLARGGTGADLSTGNAKKLIRVNDAGTAFEGFDDLTIDTITVTNLTGTFASFQNVTIDSGDSTKNRLTFAQPDGIFSVPAGTTGQRPFYSSLLNPSGVPQGTIRYNTSLERLEYNAGDDPAVQHWEQLPSLSRDNVWQQNTQDFTAAYMLLPTHESGQMGNIYMDMGFNKMFWRDFSGTLGTVRQVLDNRGWTQGDLLAADSDGVLFPIDISAASKGDVLSYNASLAATGVPPFEFVTPSGGGGGVSSVAISAPSSVFSVSGSPVTSTGTLTLSFATGKTVNQVLGTDGSGAVGMLSLTASHIPSLSAAKITSGQIAVANGGTGLSALGTGSQVLRTNAGATAMEWATLSGSGTVTSVAVSAPTSVFSISGSPITGSGTLALSFATGKTANQVLGTDGSGAVGMLSLTSSHIPALPTSILTSGQLGGARGGTGADLSAAVAGSVPYMATTGVMETVAGGIGVANMLVGWDSGGDDLIAVDAASLPSSAVPFLGSFASPLLTFQSWTIDESGTTYILSGTAKGVTGATSQTAAFSNETDGRFIQNNSTTSINADAGWQSTATVTKLNWTPLFATRIKTGNVKTTCRNWVGLAASDLMGTDTPTTIHMAAFRASSTASDTNWQCITSDASGTLTVTDSGVAWNVIESKDLIIDCRTAGTIKFYIDGNLVATHTTHLPSATTLLLWEIKARATAASASRRIYTAPVYLLQK